MGKDALDFVRLPKKLRKPGNFGKRTIPSCVICPNLIKRATNSIKIGQRDNEPSLYAQTT